MKILSILKKIFLFIIYLPYILVVLFVRGFQTLSLFFSRGFYFYFDKISQTLGSITRLSFFKRLSSFFQRRGEHPWAMVSLVGVFVLSLTTYDYFHFDTSRLVTRLPDSNFEDFFYSHEKDDKNDLLTSNELNLFHVYDQYQLKDIHLKKLKEYNSDTVLWMMVEGTAINYPIVQRGDNDYYLNHSYDYSYTRNGWPFLDHRNNKNLKDQNSIFYGHNLLNGTNFGSLKNILYQNIDSQIMILTSDEKKHIYQVFAAYEIEPSNDYLQTKFSSSDEYQEYLDQIVERNQLSFTYEVTPKDRIITLSTCRDDNLARVVVHAVEIEVSKI